MPGDPVGWTSLIAYGVQEPFVSFPVLFVADLQNDRSAEPLDTLPAAGLGAAARAASPLIPPLSADIAESGTTTFLVPHTEHRSFAFDVAVQDESDAELHEAPGALDELARVDGAFRQVAPDLSDHEVELPWGDETDAGDLSELLAFLDGQGVSGPRAVLPTTATPAAAMWSSRAGAPLAAAIETGGMAVGEPAGRRTLRNAWATGQPLAPTLAAAQPLASLASTLSWLGSLAGIDQLERLNNLLDAPFDSPLGDAVATPVIVPLTRFASLGRFASILSTMSFPGLADVMPFGLDHLEDLSAFDHPETGAAIGVSLPALSIANSVPIFGSLAAADLLDHLPTSPGDELPALAAFATADMEALSLHTLPPLVSAQALRSAALRFDRLPEPGTLADFDDLLAEWDAHTLPQLHDFIDLDASGPQVSMAAPASSLVSLPDYFGTVSLPQLHMQSPFGEQGAALLPPDLHWDLAEMGVGGGEGQASIVGVSSLLSTHVFGDLRVDGLDWERLGTGLAAEGFEVFLADGGPLHITSMHHLTALASVDSIGGTEGVFDDLEDRNALLPDYELVRFAPAAPPLASFPNARCAHLRGAGHSGRPDITHWLPRLRLSGLLCPLLRPLLRPVAP